MLRAIILALSDKTNELQTRREKLSALRDNGNAFPNDFRRDSLSNELHQKYDAMSAEELEAANVEVSIAGRMMTRRIMGKASFATLQDMGSPSNTACVLRVSTPVRKSLIRESSRT